MGHKESTFLMSHSMGHKEYSELHTSKAQAVQPNYSTWQQKGVLTQFKVYYLLKSIQMLWFCLILYTAKFVILPVNVEGIPLLEENATKISICRYFGSFFALTMVPQMEYLSLFEIEMQQRCQFVAISRACIDDGSTDWVLVFVWPRWNEW